jgi:pimeloyl-ACP methyl ester carboxylesterase
LKLKDGRTLAFAEWGELGGRPVLLFHGRPGSRLLCPDEEATEAVGVRLITVDRPGYGRSDPRGPGRTLLDWADDVAGLADRLELERFPVVGWSSGGPHALACAVRIPERVGTVGLAAASGPWPEVPGASEALPEDVRRLIGMLSTDPPAAFEGIRNRVQWYAEDPESLLAPVDGGPEDPDDALLADPAIREAVRIWMREGARQGVRGFVEDWVAELGPWGFSVSEVTHDVVVWWGEQDVLVSRAHTDYLASTLPNSSVVTYPDEGHLFPVSHWEEMLVAVAKAAD